MTVPKAPRYATIAMFAVMVLTMAYGTYYFPPGREPSFERNGQYLGRSGGIHSRAQYGTRLLNETEIRAKALAAVPASTILEEPEQVWVHTPEGFRRGARTVLKPTGRTEEWEVVLDATDGSVLRRVNRLQQEGVRP
jgi:hypothetical protein